MKKFLLHITFLFAAGLLSMIAQADEELSNQYLQRAMNELEAAKVYVQEAQAERPTHPRTVFHYQWILSDIDNIEAGIQQQFNRPRVQPRVIEPVKGDYLTVVGEGK